MPGGKSSDGGAKQAAKIQAQATEKAAALERQTQLDNWRLSLPQMVAGESALNQMMDILGLPRLQQRTILPSTLPTTGGINDNGTTAGSITAAQGVPGQGLGVPAQVVIKPGGVPQFVPLAASGAAGAPMISDALTPTATGVVPKTPWTLSLADYAKDPSAQLQLQKSEKALDRMFSARGLMNSGAKLKALQDNANLQFGDFYNRKAGEFGTYWGNLAGIAGVGSSAVQNQQGLNAQSAARQGELLAQGANAQASGIIGGNAAAAQSRQSGFNNLLNLGGLGLGAYGMFSNPVGAAAGTANIVSGGMLNRVLGGVGKIFGF